MIFFIIGPEDEGDDIMASMHDDVTGASYGEVDLPDQPSVTVADAFAAFDFCEWDNQMFDEDSDQGYEPVTLAHLEFMMATRNA
jgi:hypothetical protein